MNSDGHPSLPVTPNSKTNWWLALAILVAVTLLALVYYRTVWGGVPALVEALDHCRELYCDFNRQYYPTGREVLVTGQPSKGYFYSSFFALMLVPLGQLELGPATVWWSIVQLVGILLLLLPGVDFYRRSPVAFTLYVLLLAFSMPLLHNLKWGQVSSLVTGAAFLTLFLHRRGWIIAAAVVLALAAAIKYYVAVLLLYYLVRRDWRFLIAFTIAFLLFWLVVPTVILGPDGNWTFYQTVSERVAHAMTTWMPEDINAQYMPSVVGRWLDSSDGRMLWRLVGYCVFVANALIVARLAHRGGTRAAEWSFALLFLSLPFVAETSWPHYFVYLPFAQTLVWLELRARAGTEEGWNQNPVVRLSRWALLLTSIILASMPFFQWVGRWQDYSSLGFLFLANLSLFLLAHVLIFPGAATEPDRPAQAVKPAT